MIGGAWIPFIAPTGLLKNTLLGKEAQIQGWDLILGTAAGKENSGSGIWPGGLGFNLFLSHQRNHHQGDEAERNGDQARVAERNQGRIGVQSVTSVHTR